MKTNKTPEADSNREIWLVKTDLELGDGRPLCGNVVDVEFARNLERERNRLKQENEQMKRLMGQVAQVLLPCAANRRFMQIAGPARQCLNLVKPYTLQGTTP